MNQSAIQIALPLQGFLVRDYALTALAEIASSCLGALEVTSGNAIIRNVDTDVFLRRYGEVLQQEFRGIKLFQADFKSRDKILAQVGSLTETKPTDIAMAVEEYGKWVEKERNIIESLSRLEFRPDGRTIIEWGIDPEIEALQYFKLNFYAGRRSFLPSKFTDAKMKLDIHTTMLLLLGASLSLVGNRRIGKSNVVVHLSYQDPGARILWQSLRRLMVDIRYQTEPLLVFRLATAFELEIPGFQPIALFEVSAVGNKPALLSYHSIEVDHYLAGFVKGLRGDRFLENLMIFALRNWNEGQREFRLVAHVAYKIASTIYLMLTSSSVDKEGELYRIARYTYETTGDDFVQALIYCRRQLGLWPRGERVDVKQARGEFRKLLAKVAKAICSAKGL